ncbi:MAG: hypothetical protein Q8O95_03225 [bacterium]|nr:hypothetical protein [bacterium]
MKSQTNSPAVADRTRTSARPFTQKTAENLSKLGQDQHGFTVLVLASCFANDASERALKVFGKDRIESLTPIEAVRECALIQRDLHSAAAVLVESKTPIQNSPVLASRLNSIAMDFEAVVKDADWKDSAASKKAAEAISSELQQHADTLRNAGDAWVSPQYYAAIQTTIALGYGILNITLVREFCPSFVRVEMTPANYNS